MKKDSTQIMDLTSIIFVTRNRKDLLFKAIIAVKAQSVPIEVIVMDDASDDGTDKMILSNFDSIIYRRSEKNFGPSYQRNEGAKLASSEIIFFLDDDTIIQDPYTIEKTILNFDKQYIGAVTIPFINILQNNVVWGGSPNENETYIYHSFIAAAFAIRKVEFLKLGGFRKEYFYMGEEGDLCIRLLETGFLVKAGTSKPALHYQPANRVSYNADYYGRRNDILFLFLNSPKIYTIIYIFFTIVKGVLFGIKVRRMKSMSKGIVSGLKLLYNPTIGALRNPTSLSTFKKFRYVKKYEPVHIEHVL